MFNSLSLVNRFLSGMGHHSSFKRDLIVKVLLRCEHFDALMLRDRIKEEFDVRVSLATIYKQLSILDSYDIIRLVEIKGSRVRVYELSRYREHSHIVCLCCGKTVEIDIAMIKPFVEELALKEEFLMTGCGLSLYGYCEECGGE